MVLGSGFVERGKDEAPNCSRIVVLALAQCDGSCRRRRDRLLWKRENLEAGPVEGGEVLVDEGVARFDVVVQRDLQGRSQRRGRQHRHTRLELLERGDGIAEGGLCRLEGFRSENAGLR